MAGRLDGVWVKLARADSHLDTIKKSVERIVHTDPDVICGEFDKKSGHYVFRAPRGGADAHFLSAFIGDFLHNVGAALDYLVVELVKLERNTPTGKTSFPIFVDSKHYRKDIRTKLWGIPPSAVTIFERLQPFYGPNSDPFHPEWRDPIEEPLWHLYTLHKRDKHNALNLTENVISALPLVEGLQVPPSPGIFAGGFERGAVIATLDLGGRRDVDVYLRATYDVAFDRGGPAAGEPVVQVLDNIREVVRFRVVPAFAHFFPDDL